MKFITLVTDFGLQDGYAGILKGVIWNIFPGVQIADLSHDIAPQDILGGSLVLERSTPFFPPGTVHIGVIDPGVGTSRRPIAALIGDFYFIGPDNGLIGLLIEHAHRHSAAIEIVHLTQPRFWLDEVSQVFHGRDIFAPVGAYLAKGCSLSELGEIIHDPGTLQIPQPNPQDNGWRGEVIHIDHFGNLATNIKLNHLRSFDLSLGHSKQPSGVRAKVHFGEHTIDGLSHTYGDSESGQLIALMDSANRLSISIVNGNAAQRLEAHVGEVVEIVKA